MNALCKSVWEARRHHQWFLWLKVEPRSTKLFSQCIVDHSSSIFWGGCFDQCDLVTSSRKSPTLAEGRLKWVWVLVRNRTEGLRGEHVSAVKFELYLQDKQRIGLFEQFRICRFVNNVRKLRGLHCFYPFKCCVVNEQISCYHRFHMTVHIFSHIGVGHHFELATINWTSTVPRILACIRHETAFVLPWISLVIFTDHKGIPLVMVYTYNELSGCAP